MPADPKIVLDESVMRYALAAPSKLRSQLVASLEQLQRSPAEPPDFREQDATGGQGTGVRLQLADKRTWNSAKEPQHIA